MLISRLSCTNSISRGFLRNVGKRLLASSQSYVFLTGFLIGAVLALLSIHVQQKTTASQASPARSSFKSVAKKHVSDLHEEISPENFKLRVRELSAWVDVPSQDKDYEDKDDSVAVNLTKSVQISCIVLTTEAQHTKNAKFIKDTWGNRCTDLLFVSTKNDAGLGAQVFGNFTSAKSKWGMVKAGLKHAYKTFRSEWILKTEDTAYFVMENLREMLSKLNASESTYYGFRLKPKVKQGYMSGDPGYVISRSSLEKLVQGFDNKTVCRTDDKGYEDIEMGKCAEKLGIIPADTRDELQRYRFMPFTPEKHIITSSMRKYAWFKNSTYYPLKTGLECCSDHAVGFSQLNLRQMYAMEFLLYRVHRYGVHRHFQ